MKIDEAGNSSQDESSKEDGGTSCDVDKEKLDKTAESVEEGNVKKNYYCTFIIKINSSTKNFVWLFYSFFSFCICLNFTNKSYVLI